MKTDNELIAEFMGLDWQNQEFEWRVGARRPMKIEDLDYYRTSWNWIMPVVEKIYKVAPKDVQEINNENLSIFEFGSIAVPIEDVYKSVVEFIKWYNENKSVTAPSSE